MLPDQISRPSVHRLDGVGHVRRQEHHAIVHDRRNLLSHSVFERPRPFQLQVSDVLRRNLSQRAVAPTRVIAVAHQPIRVWRSRKHLVSDRRIVLDGAWHGQTRSRRSRCRGVVIGSSPSTPTTATASRRRSGRSRQARRHLAIGNRRNRDIGRRRKRARARLRAIGLQEKRDDRCVRVVGKTVRVFRRHRLTDTREQQLGRVGTPGVHECGTGERGRLTTARKCAAVTCGTALHVRRLALRRLRLGKCRCAGDLLSPRGHGPTTDCSRYQTDDEEDIFLFACSRRPTSIRTAAGACRYGSS